MRRQLSVFLICIASVAGIVVTASAASGHANTDRMWNMGDAVGDCGLTSGGYVKALEANLWADHRMGPNQDTAKSQVNGYYDVYTENGVRGYQSANSLSVDGCAGSATWYKMSTAHRTYVGTNSSYGGSEVYRFKTVFSEYVSHLYVLCPRRWMVQWFDGEWKHDHLFYNSPGTCVPGP